MWPANLVDQYELCHPFLKIIIHIKRREKSYVIMLRLFFVYSPRRFKLQGFVSHTKPRRPLEMIPGAAGAAVCHWWGNEGTPHPLSHPSCWIAEIAISETHDCPSGIAVSLAKHDIGIVVSNFVSVPQFLIFSGGQWSHMIPDLFFFPIIQKFVFWKSVSIQSASARNMSPPYSLIAPYVENMLQIFAKEHTILHIPYICYLFSGENANYLSTSFSFKFFLLFGTHISQN